MKIIDLDAKRDEKKLQDFHSKLMGDVRDAASKQSELVQSFIDAGKFPLKIGTRFTTDHSRRNNLPPMKITGYYVDPKNPEGRYGYYVEREDEKSMHMIRDPKLEKIHGAEKWAKLQAAVRPFTGLRSV